MAPQEQAIREMALDREPATSMDPEDEDTIALELSPEEMRVLLRAAEAQEAEEVQVRAAVESLPQMPPATSEGPRGTLVKGPPRRALMAMVISVASALLVLSGVVYLATRPAPAPSFRLDAVTPSVAAMTEPPAEPPADLATVRFTNPFDATEVFEFPPGTSEIEARNAVADLLLERARDRRDAGSKTTRAGRRSANRATPLSAATLSESEQR